MVDGDAQHRGGGWTAARRLEGPGAVLLPTRTGARARAELSIAAIATVCLSLCVRYKYPRCRTTSGASSWAGTSGLGYVGQCRFELYMVNTAIRICNPRYAFQLEMILFLGEAV